MAMWKSPKTAWEGYERDWALLILESVPLFSQAHSPFLLYCSQKGLHDDQHLHFTDPNVTSLCPRPVLTYLSWDASSYTISFKVGPQTGVLY